MLQTTATKAKRATLVKLKGLGYDISGRNGSGYQAAFCESVPLELYYQATEYQRHRMRPKLKLSHKGLLLVAVPLLCVVLFVSVLSFLLYTVDQEAARQARAKQLVSNASAFQKTFFDSLTAIFLYAFTKDDAMSARFDSLTGSIPDQLRNLGEEGSSHPELKDKFIPVETSAALAMKLLNEAKVSIDEGGRKVGILRAAEARQRIQTCMQELIENLNTYIAEAVRLEKYDAGKMQTMRQLIAGSLVAAVLLSILTACAIALFFSRDVSQRVLTIRDNSRRLSLGEQLGPPVSGEDEIKELDDVFRDMANKLSTAQSELQKSESLLRNILDTAPQGILIVDSHADIQFANKSTGSLFRTDSQSVQARNLKEFLPTDATESSSDWLRELKQQTLEKEIESSITLDNATVIPVSLSSVRFPSGDEDRTLITISDITERRKIEQMKQQFVAMLSHDLRSPLTALQIFLASLKNGHYGELTGEAIQKVGGSQHNVARLIGIINDLLHVEKYAEGRMELKRTTVFLNDLFVQSCDLVQALADEKNVNLEIEETDLALSVDEEKISRLITNLMSNGIKFAPRDSTVLIRSQIVDSFAEIHVIDSGPGLDVSEHEVIFERFYQSKNSTLQAASGSGLGLTICKAIVEAHGGNIGINSTLGSGCDFWFRLKVDS